MLFMDSLYQSLPSPSASMVVHPISPSSKPYVAVVLSLAAVTVPPSAGVITTEMSCIILAKFATKHLFSVTVNEYCAFVDTTAPFSVQLAKE